MTQNMAGTSVSLRELLAHQSGLTEEYEKTFGLPPETLSLGFLTLAFNGKGPGHLAQISFGRRLDGIAALRSTLVDIRTRFPCLTNWCVSEIWHGNPGTTLVLVNVRPPSDELDRIPVDEIHWRADAFSLGNLQTVPLEEALQGSISTSTGRVHVTQPINGQYLAELSASYAALFLLGSLVRYRPHSWNHAVSGAIVPDRPSDDRAISIVEAFLVHNAEQITSLIMSEIDGHQSFW